MDVEQLLELLLYGNQLKRAARTGWVQRGVAGAENVAAHTYGVTFTALVLAQLVDTPINLADVLAMATLHDLPESLTTDIPTPAWRYLPAGSKASAERQAMEAITGETQPGARLMSWWEMLVRNDSPEARLVHDADKLDQFLQAYLYERHTGNRELGEFWQNAHTFNFSAAQGVYDLLCRRRT